MTPRQIEEYRALRDTIRERSTARVWVVLAGFVAWSALMMATAAFVEPPIATLVPLLLLILTFDIVYALHTGVERVGRYIQVFFEDAREDRGWEHQAMEFGRRFPGGGIDPLFCGPFWTAIVLNLIPAAVVNPRPGPLEWMVVGLTHAVAAARIFVARRRAAVQRAVDLERFLALRTDGQRPAAADVSGAAAPSTAAPAAQ